MSPVYLSTAANAPGEINPSPTKQQQKRCDLFKQSQRFCCCFVGEGFISPGALAAVERYTGGMNVSPTRRLFTRIRQFTGNFVGRGLDPSRALVSAAELH